MAQVRLFATIVLVFTIVFMCVAQTTGADEFLFRSNPLPDISGDDQLLGGSEREEEVAETLRHMLDAPGRDPRGPQMPPDSPPLAPVPNSEQTLMLANKVVGELPAGKERPVLIAPAVAFIQYDKNGRILRVDGIDASGDMFSFKPPPAPKRKTAEKKK